MYILLLLEEENRSKTQSTWYKVSFKLFCGQNLSFYNSAFQIILRILKIFFSVSDLERENGRPEPVTVDSADTLWCGWCRQVPPFIQTYKTCQCLHFVYSPFHNEKSEITR